jgi:hypothetical protein
MGNKLSSEENNEGLDHHCLKTGAATEARAEYATNYDRNGASNDLVNGRSCV